MNGIDESLKVALKLIPAHTYYANASGALIFLNERGADYSGIPQDHPLRFGIETGAPWDSHLVFLHPDDHDETRRVWSHCINSNAAGEVAFRSRSANGEYRWFLSRVEPHRSGDGKLLGWIGINFEVEEQKQAEFYLTEGQRLAGAGSWAFTADGFEYWSSGLFRIHGLEPANKAPDISQYVEFVHPDDRGFVAQAIQRMLTDHSDFDFTKRIIRPDGAVRNIRCVGTPATDGGAFRHRFVGVAIDVTDHEQLTAALRKREEDLRQIVDFATEHVVVMTANGGRLYANRNALDYLGVNLEEWISAPLGRFVHPDDRERLRIFQQSYVDGLANGIEIRLPDGNGTYRWFMARHNPLRDEQGQLIRWYVACTDIEDRKKAEERLQRENVALREEIDKASMFDEIVGNSPALAAILSRVTKVASSDSTVLITGETGTGKELIARAIHRRSRRSTRPFVTVNCAAIPRELVASELFGHEKGAFTGATQRRLGRFELADGGTIFLDEVGELLPDTQAALLRVIQEREFERVGGSERIRVDVRVIAATNRDLENAVTGKAFRQDLFYRLNVFPVEMPPLRARGDDIPLLVEYFIDRYARKIGKTFRHVNKRTLDLLKSYPWPGNVRELQNVIERSVIICDSDEFIIDDSWLSATSVADSHAALSCTLVAHEKTIIEEALRACEGRVYGSAGAATRLGIPRSTLESKIRTLGIDKRRFKS